MPSFINAVAWRDALGIMEQEEMADEMASWRSRDEFGRLPVVRKRLVIARWNEDLNTSLARHSHIVYDKGYAIHGKPIGDEYKPAFEIVPYTVNTDGREAEVYLDHIIRSYDYLDDFTYFLQANPYVHAADLEKSLGEEGDFIPIYQSQLMECDRHGRPHDGSLRVGDAYEAIFGMPSPPNYRFSPGAQFCVSRRRIQRHKKEFYVKVREVGLTEKFSPRWGWIMERLWFSIFGDE